MTVSAREVGGPAILRLSKIMIVDYEDVHDVLNLDFVNLAEH